MDIYIIVVAIAGLVVCYLGVKAQMEVNTLKRLLGDCDHLRVQLANTLRLKCLEVISLKKDLKRRVKC